jgi:hypothetical protein
MGADYIFYTEVKRDGVWHAMNGKYYSEEKKDYVLAETYWNGSRSYFGETYNKIKEIGVSVPTKELSEEVLLKESWLTEDDDDDYPYAVVVDWKEFAAAIPKTKRKDSCGYVHKSAIWEYEAEGSEIYEYLSGEEYNELSDAVKKEYEFYEWNDPTGWRSYFKEIAKRIDNQIMSYMNVNDMWKAPENIRVVCIMSW